MRIRPAVLLAVLVLLVAGCGIPSFLLKSDEHSITVDGMERTYRVYKPKGLPSSAPLVVVLHGATGTARFTEVGSGFNDKAARDGFIVAYPDGIGHTWNARGCCGTAYRTGVDDVGFLTAMIGAIDGVDRRRVYVAGFSNGGVMAYTLACATDVVAGIGTVAATQVGRCDTPRPTSVMAINGTADEVVGFDNGEINAGDIHAKGRPVNALNEFWRNVNRCEPPVITDRGDTTLSKASCEDGREVALITVKGAGHTWPGFTPDVLTKFFLRD